MVKACRKGPLHNNNNNNNNNKINIYTNDNSASYDREILDAPQTQTQTRTHAHTHTHTHARTPFWPGKKFTSIHSLIINYRRITKSNSSDLPRINVGQLSIRLRSPLRKIWCRNRIVSLWINKSTLDDWYTVLLHLLCVDLSVSGMNLRWIPRNEPLFQEMQDQAKMRDAFRKLEEFI